eukprot:6309746-Amphidinium_carterae.1
MDEQREEVESMYQLLKQYNVRVSSEDQFQLEFLVTKGHDFTHKKILEANQHVHEQRTGMVDQLQVVSQRVEEDASDLKDVLLKAHAGGEEAILNPESVLDELSQIGATLTKLEEKAATYSDYQGVFGVPSSFEFSSVEKTKALFADKSRLWHLVSDWMEKKKYWHMTDFHKLDVEAMNKQVMDYSKTGFQLMRALDGDDVAVKIKTMIEEWKVNMPSLLELANPAMKSRHWQKIHKAINLNTSSVTLLQLANHGIFDHKELISEVSGTASGEQALEQNLEKIVAAWAEEPLP